MDFSTHSSFPNGAWLSTSASAFCGSVDPNTFDTWLALCVKHGGTTCVWLSTEDERNVMTESMLAKARSCFARNVSFPLKRTGVAADIGATRAFVAALIDGLYASARIVLLSDGAPEFEEMFAACIASALRSPMSAAHGIENWRSHLKLDRMQPNPHHEAFIAAFADATNSIDPNYDNWKPSVSSFDINARIFGETEALRIAAWHQAFDTFGRNTSATLPCPDCKRGHLVLCITPSKDVARPWRELSCSSCDAQWQSRNAASLESCSSGSTQQTTVQSIKTLYPL